MSKSKRRRGRVFGSKRDLNLVLGTVVFVLLISSAFTIDWIFGLGFIVGFILSFYNRVLERNFLIPAFIFIGALIIRYALFVLLPNVLNAQNYLSLGISLIIFLLILIIGFRIQKGRI